MQPPTQHTQKLDPQAVMGLVGILSHLNQVQLLELSCFGLRRLAAIFIWNVYLERNLN